MNSSNFIDSNIESFFEENGYAIIRNFLDPNEIILLNDLYSQFHIDQTPRLMWNSLYHTSRANSYYISEEILKIFRPKIETTFKHAKSILATVMSKCPNYTTDFDTPHRDYSILDEKEVQYRQLWCPLININEKNGAMYIIPGSHKLDHDILPVLNRCPYRDHKDFIMKYARPIFMDAGDLIVYADKTLHGGYANNSKEERPVIHFAIFPEGNQLKYYRKTVGSNVIEEYDVPDNFFIENVIEDIMNLPIIDQAIFKRQIQPKPVLVDYDRIAQYSSELVL